LMGWENCVDRNGKIFRLLVFYIKEEYFQEWHTGHEIIIGTRIKKKRGLPYLYVRPADKDPQAQDNHSCMRYECHRKGFPRIRHNRPRGGKSGKTRKRDDSIACGCRAFFNAILQVRTPQADGTVANVFRIEYRIDHNHEIGRDGTSGTLRLSKAMRDKIERMVLGGSTISAVMKQLTAEQNNFTRFLAIRHRSDGQIPLSRDEVVNYDDIYNIYFRLQAKLMHLDDDPIKSAIARAKDFRRQGYFVYYKNYKTDGNQVFGFSSPWQLQQLGMWGKVFCFDGTHHVVK